MALSVKLSAAGLRLRLWSFLLALILGASLAIAQDGTISVFTSAHEDVPDSASTDSLSMMLDTRPGGKLPIQFTTIPLTESMGLNGSEKVRTSMFLDAQLLSANVSTYNNISGDKIIAYLSCDKPASEGFIGPDQMLKKLMGAGLKAIVLYSTSLHFCSISSDGPIPYPNILSMADSGEAGKVLSYLNGSSTPPVDYVEATITGSTGHEGSGGKSGGNSSAVAMSILYTITGIITLLFLVIITTGAIRAHRHPERYGPRGGVGGRGRQSRAKGLARAVLDTIPIVKFGNQEPAKPDPNLELETGTAGHQDANQPREPADSNEHQEHNGSPALPAATRNSSEHAPANEIPNGATGDRADVSVNGDNVGENAGCSICTEDFNVGEDVRVLPCQHQFHPYCVDPWLVNVSGTCPLCRLDLRPDAEQAADDADGSTSGHDETLAPPLALEVEDGGSTHASQGNRLTRLFDVNRLRQAGVEERIAALRQMRAHAAASETEPVTETAGPAEGSPPPERSQASRLTDKLKDKFRIRTRSQPADR